MTGPLNSSMVKSACHQIMRFKMPASFARTSITAALKLLSQA
jgi:hypothetical protein